MSAAERDAAAWRDANMAHTQAVVAEMACRLRGGDDLGERRAERETAAGACAPAPALETLADAFLLTDFEREIVALAVTAELRPEVRQACGSAGGGPTGPSFGIASRVLDAPHWSALSPARPLRAAGLVELGPGPLPDAPIQLAERVLHHLLGIDDLDATLAATSTWLRPGDRLVESQERAASEIVDAWRATATWPLVRVDADRRSDGRHVAARAAALAGCLAHVVRSGDLPTDAAARAGLARAWRRELVLAPQVLVVDLDGPAVGHRDTTAVATFLDAVVGPVIVIGAGEVDTLRSQRRVRVPVPDDDEQRRAWTVALRRHRNGATGELDATVDRAVGQFRLGAAEIEELAAGLARSPEPGADLWDACRRRTRPALDALADLVPSDATWDDLVLPAVELATLRAIARHVAHRPAVQRAWGMRPGQRGRGVTALFHGPSGTGKTLAAEVIANEVGLDLYRIDLSAVVSKYVGETEKNLRQVFDAAEDGGAVLLFDEADALFGKRTEVRDSHDRYANIEVSYLLTRMETYRGLAVLTTNVRSALDAAFLRRLRFVVGFPFPDEAQRAEIWRRVFPATLATDRLEPERLARLGVTGATIHGIALHASYEAAADAGPVTIDHVLRAATRELAKLDKPITQAELAGLR